MKYFLGGLGVVLYTLVALNLAATWWVNNNFESLFNANPDRDYQITIEKIEILGIWNGLELEMLYITPLKNDSTNAIHASIAYALINGINWKLLLLDKSLEMNTIQFINPIIQLEIGEKPRAATNNSKARVSGLAGDLLSRGTIKDFKLINGSLHIKKKADNTDIFTIGSINIFVDNLISDSSTERGIIPFKTDNTIINLEDIYLKTSKYQTLNIESYYSNLANSKEVIKNIRLSLNEKWETIAAMLKVQTDIIEINIDSVVTTGIPPPDDIAEDFKYIADKVEIYNMELNDYRDQNQADGKIFRKPLFYGMINNIPLQVMIDSIVIHSSIISYNEVPKGRQKPGIISLINTDAVITGLSNDSLKQQEYEKCIIDLKTMLFGGGNTSIQVEIPYDKSDKFNLRAVLRDMPFEYSNKIMGPQAGIEAKAGTVNMLTFNMRTSGNDSYNTFSIDYKDLSIDILDEEYRKSKKGLSWVSNMFVKQNSKQKDEAIAIAQYSTQRNQNKSVFNFLWLSVKDGAIETLLSKTAKSILAKEDKETKKEVRKKKRAEKKKRNEDK